MLIYIGCLVQLNAKLEYMIDCKYTRACKPEAMRFFRFEHKSPEEVPGGFLCDCKKVCKVGAPF